VHAVTPQGKNDIFARWYKVCTVHNFCLDPCPLYLQCVQHLFHILCSDLPHSVPELSLNLCLNPSTSLLGACDILSLLRALSVHPALTIGIHFFGLFEQVLPWLDDINRITKTAIISSELKWGEPSTFWVPQTSPSAKAKTELTYQLSKLVFA